MAGDPAIDYTETHQVIVEVGYGRGPELAERLEANNIICNYQAAPDEEGFTAAGALRLGVAEMTRFGMGPDDFSALAGLMAAVILRGPAGRGRGTRPAAAASWTCATASARRSSPRRCGRCGSCSSRQRAWISSDREV